MYVAEVELLLTEELRSFSAADIRIGRIGVQAMQVDHISVDDGNDIYLIKIMYDLLAEDSTPPLRSATLGIAFHTPDVRIRDAWPRLVTMPCPPERLAVTERLEFVRHTSDAHGLLVDHVPVPKLTPEVRVSSPGGVDIRWQHTATVRPGAHNGWLIVMAPTGCHEIEVRVTGDHTPERTLGMHARGKPDTMTIRLPHRRSESDGLRYRIGFTVDIVDYSSRPSDQQRIAQQRLLALLQRFTQHTGVAVEPGYFQATGDGFNSFLPDIDAVTAMRHLVCTMPHLLGEDNLQHADQIKLRMAIDVGPVEPSELGFAGPTVIRFCRMANSEPAREAMGEPDTTMAIVVSDTLYDDIVRQHGDLSELPFTRHDVVVKTYQATAYLLSHKS
ncbi:hypothetical protein [Amycolatopsis sp. BJA-103]|uniref:hypothetical protein n=1 Tax=Amycolatopsis sp. BJA-103 TaxID=1911175 RepID=UPI000C75AD2E|nr:hypothetical protein [Amycolatopsis sp. BJA-103]AUI60391.1 hypothetical protein BKN51_20790 [Amycolatopsis sp. BJA-103]PNE16415.1 hypothetical protein B1H26_24415 [Amycolatopsis sp. BJA-103]